MNKLAKTLRNPIFGGLVLILALGIVLRILHLTWEDIWYDETVTIQAAKMSFPKMFKFTLSPVDITDFPPVYYTLMKVWMGIFGDSPVAVRSSSALCGVLSIIAMYLAGKSLFDEKHGLLAALFMAVSPFDINYSQETRAYALQVFLVSLSIYFFLKALQKDTRKLWWIYALISLFAVYVHFFSAFVWASIFIFHIIYLLRKKNTFKNIL